MSDSLKLSTALPGDDEINGLDALAEELTHDPSRMICAVLILDVKDVRYIRDLEAHVPTLRFRRGEAWLLNDTPEEVRLAMIERAEERMGRTPLPFGDLGATKAQRDDRPDPDDCDHTDFVVERDHLEDVPDGMFRETCLRCGWVQYQPVEDLQERIEAMEGNEPTLIRPDDVPEVWVYGDGDEPQDDER